MKISFLSLSLLIASMPLLGQADQVATSAAMSVLQAQMSAMTAEISTAQQTLSTVNQTLQNLQGQSAILKQQIAKYSDTDAKQFKWIDITDTDRPLPSDAFIAAKNKNTSLSICQATYSNDSSNYYGGNNTGALIPGVVTSTGCVITYNGQAYLEPIYAVLTSNVLGYWINGDQIKNNTPQRMPIYPAESPPSPSNQPQPLYNSLAIIGGQDNGLNTYICRVNINNQYFIGKNSNGTCYIAAGAYEANWPVYQVLLSRKP